MTLAALLLLSAPRLLAAVDQEQPVYDGGTSARTLPGYTVWQSFAAGVTGTLSRIDMGFFNDMSGSARLSILEGEGTAGVELASLDVPVVGLSQPGVTWNAWTVSVPVEAGSIYTFRIEPDAATLPDPYGVAIGSASPYARGVMGLDDPSGTYETPFDVVFRTYVDGGMYDVYRAESPEDVASLPWLIAQVPASPHDDASAPSVPLLCYEVEDASGAPDIIQLRRLQSGAVHVEW